MTESSYPCPIPFLKFCPTSQHPPTLFVALFLCVILINDIMDLNLSSLGNLVLTTPCCVFYATRNQIYTRCNTNNMVFVRTLICYYTQRRTDTSHRDQSCLGKFEKSTPLYKGAGWGSKYVHWFTCPIGLLVFPPLNWKIKVNTILYLFSSTVYKSNACFTIVEQKLQEYFLPLWKLDDYLDRMLNIQV